MNRRARSILWGLATFLALGGSCTSAVSTESLPSASLDDGPYVRWTVDSTGTVSASVFYYCDGMELAGHYGLADTLRFSGLCHDTARDYTVVAAPPAIPPARYRGVRRVLAVSDLHGEYEAFRDFLLFAGVIDSRLHWIWGDGHLVIVGDVFDRGDRVTECLWLIHQLEGEARAAGGAVHMLLGNHEAMALRGDERYVNEKYLNGIVAAMATADEFRYMNLFGSGDELGRWLRSKNTAIVIDDVLFVHGGIAPELMRRGLSLEAVNEAVRTGIEYPIGDSTIPESAGFMQGSLGPLWYRGWQYGIEDKYPPIRPEQLDSVLASYEATAAVSGHSEVDSVLSMHDGRVYFIDIPVDELGGFEGLLWQNGVFYRVRPDGTRVRLE